MIFQVGHLRMGFEHSQQDGISICSRLLYVILRSSTLIDPQVLVSLINRAAEAVVVLSSIEVVGVVLWVVNVIFWSVAAKTLGGDFELFGAVSKGS